MLQFSTFLTLISIPWTSELFLCIIHAYDSTSLFFGAGHWLSVLLAGFLAQHSWLLWYWFSLGWGLPVVSLLFQLVGPPPVLFLMGCFSFFFPSLVVLLIHGFFKPVLVVHFGAFFFNPIFNSIHFATQQFFFHVYNYSFFWV